MNNLPFLGKVFPKNGRFWFMLLPWVKLNSIQSMILMKQQAGLVWHAD